MRFPAVLFSLAACGSSNPLEGKDWKETLDYNDASYSFAVDSKERLVTTGMNDRHTFRLDPGTALWDDLGPSVERNWGNLVQDGNGGIYNEWATENVNELPRRRIYRLDDRSWTRLAGFDSNLSTFVALDGTWWGSEWSESPLSTTLYKLVDGMWTQQQVFTDRRAGFLSDRTGQLYLYNENGKGLWKVNASFGLDVVLECGTVLEPGCTSSITGFNVDSSGNIVYIAGDSIMGHALYRIRPGSKKAELLTKFPDIDVDAPHIFGYAYDGDDNAYLVYGNNVTTAADLFFLASGSTDWQEIIEWPVGNTTYFPYVGKNGTVYAANTGGPHLILQ
jgi:hypothetical protein